MSARTAFLAALFACAGAASSDTLKDLTVKQLQRYLYVRGVSCDHCTGRQAFLAKAEDSINLPVSSELIAQYEEELQYKRLVKKFNLTKPEFIEQMNVTESPALDDARAERLWATFQEQLGRGGVQFLENGTISFSMPVTHRLSLVLPPAVCDAIEAAHAWLRGHYLQVPRMYRRRLEVRLDWAVESGAIFGLLCTLLLMLALDMGYSALCSLRMRPSAGDAATPKSKKA